MSGSVCFAFVLVGITLAVAFGGAAMFTWQRRRARLLRRQCLPADEWFRLYLPDVDATRPMLTEILEALGKEIGVEWTRLRPDDTFNGTLRAEPWSVHQDDLDGFSCDQANWAKRHGIRPDDIPLYHERLDDHLRELDALLRPAVVASDQARTT